MAERQSPKAWIGWQGIRLRVPADWTIGQISGDADDGALRIDSANTPRVQVKWKKRGSGVVDIDRTLQDYVNALTKRRKREDAKIDVQLGGKHLSRRKKKKSQLRCFSWRGEQQAYGAAWHCSECDRTVICQVLGHLDEELESLAQEVLLSLEDHPQDGWTMWATYGLECWTPQDFDLADQKLMAGLIELRFACETEKIVIRRWGMSDIALRGKDLQQWAKQELVKGLKLYDWSAESTTFRGHSGAEDAALLPPHRPQAVRQRGRRPTVALPAGEEDLRGGVRPGRRARRAGRRGL